MIKPPRLVAGDRVAAISLSWGGAGDIRHRFDAGVRQIEAEFGVTVVPTRHALHGADFISKNPQARAEDLHEALVDTSIKGIFTNIGGDDSLRCLPFLDFDLLRKHPKVFLGFSDTTVHHYAFLKAGVTSFYGPSILAGLAENCGMMAYLVESLRKAIFDAEPIGLVEPNRDGWTIEHLDWMLPENHQIKRKLNPPEPWRWIQGTGSARGHLLGGCLEVIDWLRGTSVWPDRSVWDGAILFLETSEDKPTPQQVTWALRACAAAGMFVNPAAILLARPCTDSVAEIEAQEEAVRKFVVEELGRTDLPIVTRLDFGHTSPIMTLPFGVQAEVDCSAQTFTILESGVS